MKAALVVLNYNGKEMLGRFLPSILREAKASIHSVRVVMVDNQSHDGSVEYVKDHFTEVHVYCASENKVLCSYNDFAAISDEEVMVLLNNDLELMPGFVDPLLAMFEKKSDIFFSASHGNRSIACVRFGILSSENQYPNFEKYNEMEGTTFAAGVLAVSRSKFLALGGFDEIFLPGRYEDVDLCYRAWARGWKGYYVPQATQHHLGGASFDAYFGFKKTQRMVFRNSLLFMVKNIHDKSMIFKCFFFTAMRLPFFILTGKFFLFLGFIDFLTRLPRALRARIKAKKERVLDDKSVIKNINSFYAVKRG